LLEIIKLQKKIVPEIVELLEKRYNILRTLYYYQPVGRRILSNNLSIGERSVRTELDFLKEQNLINVNTSGMTLTPEGELIIDKLKEFIHELKGLTDIEVFLKNKLNLKDVIIVPGDIEEDKTVLNELGRIAALYIKSIIKDGSIISLTGGSTIQALIDNMPKVNNISNLLVVPARGGIGRNVDIQSSTLAAKLAKKIGASYKLLHVPDNLSDTALKTILNEKDIKDVIDSIHHTDILIYGIGKADEMARRRGMSEEIINTLNELGTAGEAFGYYFDNKGEIVYSTPTIGIKIDDINQVKNLIAIAGGKSKACAIAAIESNKYSHGSVLIIDEGAALAIADLIS
jgi:central glycolytic genes regulator